MVRAAGDVDGDAAAAVGEGATFDQRGRRAIPAARRLALMLDDDARRDARFAQCDCGGVGLLVVVAGGSINSDVRSAERSGGKACVRTCRSWWSPSHY